jgi:hypothetical protein
MNQLWKSLRAGIKSDYDGFQWTIGKWESLSNPPTEKCVGFNASERIVRAMSYVPMEVLARVEVDGVIIRDADKWTCEKMRILEAWEWTEEESVCLSIFAAELVLPKFEEAFPDDARPRKAIEAAKYWLNCHVAAKDAAKSAEDATLSAVYSAWWRKMNAANAAWSAISAARSAEDAQIAGSAEHAALSALAADAVSSMVLSAAYAASSAKNTARSAADLDTARSAEWAARSAVNAVWSVIAVDTVSSAAYTLSSAEYAALSVEHAISSVADVEGRIEGYIYSRIPHLKCLRGNKGG